jgi:hypothetical protein
MPPKKKPTRAKKTKSQTGKGALNRKYAAMNVPHGFRIDHPQYGTGFFDFIKKGFNWLKNNKVVSTVAKLIPHPAAQTVGNIAEQLGGKKRRRVYYV